VAGLPGWLLMTVAMMGPAALAVVLAAAAAWRLTRPNGAACAPATGRCHCSRAGGEPGGVRCGSASATALPASTRAGA
jgi:hypothetical protein